MTLHHLMSSSLNPF